MELTKKQAEKRKGCILKAHPWFGSDELGRMLKRGYDYYVDHDDKVIYVYSRKLAKVL
jgi:hypothetical protein